MSADLSEPSISTAYDAITRNLSTNWMLLAYGSSTNKLTLYASGNAGIDEMRTVINQDEVYFGFCREDGYFALITFFPETISGVRRARALVHSRAVAAMLRAHQTVVSATKLEHVTEENVRTKLGLPLRKHLPVTPPADSDEPFEPLTPPPPPLPSKIPVLSPSAAGPSSPVVSPGMTSPRSRSYSKTRDTPLPPTPPKDEEPMPNVRSGTSSRARAPSAPTTDDYSATPARPRGLSGTSVERRVMTEYSPAPVRKISYGEMGRGSTRLPVAPRTEAQEQAARSRAQWAAEAARSEGSTYSPIAPSRTSELQKRKEAEEQEMLRAEAEIAARKKFEKEQRLREEMEEEERRAAEMEELRRRYAAERVKREQERREQEEIERREAEERRVAEEQRREQRRREREAAEAREKTLREAHERRMKEAQEQRQREQSERIKTIQSKFTAQKPGEVLLTGYIGVQTPVSVVWRRRWFELSGEALFLYKSEADISRPLDVLRLSKQQVRGIREWSDGYEELQAIPNSFVIEFKNDEPWMFFTDSADDKEVVTSLLRLAAGI